MRELGFTPEHVVETAEAVIARVRAASARAGAGANSGGERGRR
jgi:hypothetical protein